MEGKLEKRRKEDEGLRGKGERREMGDNGNLRATFGLLGKWRSSTVLYPPQFVLMG